VGSLDAVTGSIYINLAEAIYTKQLNRGLVLKAGTVKVFWI
jgi:hypothetical protein